MLIVL
jgi:hypothetical protein